MIRNSKVRTNNPKDYPNANLRPLNGGGGITRREAEEAKC
jgi:hypothetical protein